MTTVLKRAGPGNLAMNKVPHSPEWRRALETPATVGESGCAEATLIARGFLAEMLKSLVCLGLATPMGGQPAPRMRITEAGQRMLAAGQQAEKLIAVQRH
jgi:hypothetical protein